MKRYFSTTATTATKRTGKFAGNISEMQLTEQQQARLKATDTNQAHQQFLRAHGLAQYDPSELFSSI